MFHASSGFSARFDARARTYTYRIATGDAPPLLTRKVTWWHRLPLDVEAMECGASYLVGEHDFKSFCKMSSAIGKPTCRNVIEVSFEREGALGEEHIAFTITGKMCIRDRGNSLRRVLLSSLEGAAVEAIQIDGAQHEFTTIPNMVEDVTDIVLNVKGLVFRTLGTTDEGTATISVDGPCEVTGADFFIPSEFELVNPEQHIATLTEGGHLTMSMRIGYGRGYVSYEPVSYTHLYAGRGLNGQGSRSGGTKGAGFEGDVYKRQTQPRRGRSPYGPRAR